MAINTSVSNFDRSILKDLKVILKNGGKTNKNVSTVVDQDHKTNFIETLKRTFYKNFNKNFNLKQNKAGNLDENRSNMCFIGKSLENLNKKENDINRMSVHLSKSKCSITF